jgi:predicted DNA-binding transcriptional regulator YafY
MSRGRNSQSSRQIVLQQMLQAAGRRGLSPREITEKLKDRGYEVTKRTIHRDLEGLQAAGIPVSESGSKSDDGGVRWTIDVGQGTSVRSGQSAVLKISPRQLAGLYFAKEQFKTLARSELFTGLDHFFEQVSDLIGSRNRELLDEFARDFYVSHVDSAILGATSDVVETIHAAIIEGHCIKAQYQSANSGTDRIRELGPHYLCYMDRGLYLVAEDLEESKIKNFAVPRIKSAELMDKPYEGQKTSPEAFYSESFGAWRSEGAVPVEIKVIKSRAPFVAERQWHPSQEIIKHRDGSITLKLKVGLTPTLVGWILSLGDHAEVITPQRLKDDVCKAALAVAARYRKKAG